MADDIYGPRPQANQVRNVRNWPGAGVADPILMFPELV
jgi:hypothetical protein